VTSGLGQDFPAGYPVGRVTEIRHRGGEQFLEISASPIAALDRSRYVLPLFERPQAFAPATVDQPLRMGPGDEAAPADALPATGAAPAAQTSAGVMPAQAATATPATTPAAASNLISFLKALPDCRMRRGVRFPQWWMLLVAILSILSGQGSLVGMERFAKRHRQTLNELLGTDFAKSPSDSTFRLLLAQLDVAGFESQGRLKVCPAQPWRLRRSLVCSRGVPLRDARDRSPCH